jgi:two-component system, chemotaxis family, CheB/CheR fusion protein
MHRFSTALAVMEHQVSDLRLIVEHHTGVLLDISSDVIADLISEKTEALRLSGTPELLDRLRASDVECERFLESLLDGTTGFFAHPEAFDSLARFALPQLLQNNNRAEDSRTLRVWSAGCATGEEAYSVAISLCEEVNCLSGDWNIRIVGSDIRQEALKIAERGLYPESALAQIPRPLLQSYFAKVGLHFLVKPRIRNLVSFTSMNLANAGYLGRFHCIFCMDVLRSFSMSQRAALVQRLHLYLEPGGFLFLGESEKLPASSVKFEAVKNFNYTLYRKPRAVAAASGH